MAWKSILPHVSVTSGVTLLAVGGLSLIWYVTCSLRDKRPPFPWIRLPLIGNIISLMSSKEKAYLLFYKTSKKPKYDKVFMIKIGSLEFCVINHIEAAREALIKKQADFADRLPIYSLLEVTNGGKDIVFAQFGPEWRFLRKLAHQALRNFASGKKLECVVQKATKQVIDLLKQKGDEAFIIKPNLELVQFNIFTGFLFGKEYKFDDPKFKQFMNTTLDGLQAFGTGLPADVFPWMRFLPFHDSRLKCIRVIMDKITGLIETELKEHKETFDPDNLRDLTDYLLMAQQDLEKEDSKVKELISDIYLVMTLFDIFGAGLDTINATLQAAIAEAIMHPEIQDRLATEVKKAVGDQLPGVSDRINLPYTEAFLCEVLRHDTFAVFGVPLATTCDTTIGKYELPKGTGVLINFWALHNDPNFWEDPSEFRPERFLQENGELAPRPESFMPFSAGKRVCLGENLSKTMLMIILPMLFQQLKFIKPDSFEYVYEDSGMANILKPYEVLVQTRN